MKEKILITGGSGFIGTNLINVLTENNFDIVNLDINSPAKNEHLKFWVKCDIMDYLDLELKISSTNPKYIVHLAAKTDTLSQSLDDYAVNIKGTDNLIKISNKINSISKIIITSTQYVYKNKILPKGFDDYIPHTAYGMSKVNTEEITRKHCEKNFVIVRPTNIWGPYSLNYANGLFKMIEKGFFAIPSKANASKSFGYVENICHQFYKIILDESNSGEVFYVGEKQINSNEWSQKINLSLTGKLPMKIPNWILYGAALFGELFIKVNIPFPLYLTRYRNMTEDYNVPIDKTIERYGVEYTDLQKNIDKTISWYRNDYKE